MIEKPIIIGSLGGREWVERASSLTSTPRQPHRVFLAKEGTERERKRETETERDTERQTERETERQRETERDRKTEKETNTERDTQRDRERERETEKETNTERDTQRDREERDRLPERDRDTDRHARENTKGEKVIDYLYKNMNNRIHEGSQPAINPLSVQKLNKRSNE